MERSQLEFILRNLEKAPKPTSSSALAIHKYIDGVLRGGIPFTSPRPQSRGCQAGLTLGQCVDTAFCRLVDGKPVQKTRYGTPLAQRALSLLNKEGIFPIRTQFRVAYGRISTQVDAIAVARIKNSDRWQPCVIELKTSTQTAASHVKTYGLLCKRKPRIIAAGIEIENSEQNGHFIQAEFGRLGLSQFPEFAAVSTRAVVIYATKTGCRLYDCPFFSKKIFEVGGVPPQMGTSYHAFPRIPAAGKGGRQMRMALRTLGFKKVAATRAGRCSFAATLMGTPVLGALCPTFCDMSSSQQTRQRKRLSTFLTQGTVGVIVHRRSGGWAFTRVAANLPTA